jgi:hypothetical protein
MPKDDESSKPMLPPFAEKCEKSNLTTLVGS